jgi:4-hydroxybenzoate polyprenyltransferase
MSEFQNVLRGNLFLWFLAALIFTIFVIIRLIKNFIDINDDRARPE